MGLVSNFIEARGISTLVIGTARDYLVQMSPPRAVFVDHPVCRTFGRPYARRIQQKILADALRCVDSFKTKGQIIDLPHQWKDKRGSSWEEITG